ncbi:universal stress protein [Vibrio sonorensis]|uniref:universal stress protein n=1 Tax=Vibrio sonorensis TaxID=1004316 RepID=UPI0008D9237C|nr:universal stress protein [Vibrio sonorensis]
MRRFENILFATQGLPGKSDALVQAILLGASNGVPVRGLIAFPKFPGDLYEYQKSYEQALHESLNGKVHALREQSKISADQVPFPLVTKSSEQPALCIIREAMHHGIDLVIKEAEPVGEKSDGFKAADMLLLRKCPCPVWLHRPDSKAKRERRVAVAVDPVTDTEEQHKLALRLIELARSIADSCDKTLHIVSCWEHYLEHYLDEQIWVHANEEELTEQIKQESEKHKQALLTLIGESEISGEVKIHHLHGKPDEKIPEFIESMDVDVLVMGTIARTGVSGFVIGNTAENVLQSINCSLVALKPEGFVTPVK